MFTIIPLVNAMDYGVVEVDSSWKWVEFEEEFSRIPLVFTQTNSYNEADLTFTKLRNINTTGFEVKFDEDFGTDLIHNVENLGWVAMEFREFGENGLSNLRQPFPVATRTMPLRTSFSNPPYFLAEVQSNNNFQPVQIDISSLTSTSFDLRMEEATGFDGRHPNEMIAYVAFDDNDNLSYTEFGKIDVDNNWETVTFDETFLEIPTIIADINTENESDMVTILITNVTETSFEISLSEFNGFDGVHTTEEITYLALGEKAKNIVVVSTSSSGVSYIVSALDDAGHIVEEMDALDITSSLTDDYDLIIYPGGSDSYYDLLADASIGATIQNFVDNGGGYIGICGGTLIAGNNFYYDGVNVPYPSMMGLLDVNVYEYSDWVSYYVGSAVSLGHEVEMEHEIFNDYTVSDIVDITYAGGPIFTTSTEDILLSFNDDLDSSLTNYAISGEAAVVAGQYGDGKVVLSSPHPEYSSEEILLAYVEWVSS